MPVSPQVQIPSQITVHLGAAADQSAPNVTVSFPDYIKNVASSEIYPTWPENALRANIYAQISFALNRIYTEYYHSRGYDFDITNSTAADQSFVYGRNIFENISQIVDEIFNSYVVRQGSIEPLFTQYCNGTTVSCGGLSQWGSVALAQQGLTPYQILQRYYGDDINIVRNVPVSGLRPSAPAAPLALGSGGNDVTNVQIRLNRISKNYPAIPKINPVDGIYGAETEQAVRTFQQIFDLPQTGVVNEATWYRIQYIFASVKMLNELTSEGLTPQEVGSAYPFVLRLGDSGAYVSVLQYYLAFIGAFNPELPPIAITGYFNEETRDAVYAFQKYAGLPVDGIVGEKTWNLLFETYLSMLESIPQSERLGGYVPFGGTLLKRGMTSPQIGILQQGLNTIASVTPTLTQLSVNDTFDDLTYRDVLAFQRLNGFEENGIVGPLVWNAVQEQSIAIENGSLRSAGQYPGGVAAAAQS